MNRKYRQPERARQFTEILGNANDDEMAARLHKARHAGVVEEIRLGSEDLLRHRLRVKTNQGTEGVIVLRRAEHLFDGAVLLLEDDHAVVVRAGEQGWLKVRPQSRAAALELGYLAGAIHWRVRIEGCDLLVALDGARGDYLHRLKPWLSDGRAALGQDA